MSAERYWGIFINNEPTWDNFHPASIQDIKAGMWFGFKDSNFPRDIKGSLNQWHYGLATKDAYERDDGIWVVEAEDVKPAVLEIV